MPVREPPYNFGLSQEDERTEAAALGLPGGHVLSVASAGDMALSLLALGADAVTAVDVDPAQLHLGQLKLAAVRRLAREEAIGFLGYLPASHEARQDWLDRACELLPPESRAFWEMHRTAALDGAVWAGRFERFVRRLSALARPLFGARMRALCTCSSLAAQQEIFAHRIDGPLLRAVFRIAFHPSVFASRGMDRRSLQFHDRRRSLGQQYFDAFQRLCTGSPAGQNHLLQMMALGRVLSADTVPAYLSAQGFRRVRERWTHLAFEESDLLDYLRRPSAPAFDGMHLSNVPDWLPPERFDELMRLATQTTRRPGRLVWRYLHVDRPIPPALQDLLVIDRARGAQLQQSDRFPFYGIVPAYVGGADSP